MEYRKRKEFLSEIWSELDYWVEQYKYANEVTHDPFELDRISKNIKALQRVYDIYK